MVGYFLADNRNIQEKKREWKMEEYEVRGSRIAAAQLPKLNLKVNQREREREREGDALLATLSIPAFRKLTNNILIRIILNIIFSLAISG